MAGKEPSTRIRLCGRFSFQLDGRELAGSLPGGQGLSVLTYLIANRDRAPDRAQLVDVLWPFEPPKDPQAALRPILSRLRGALAPATLEGRERIELVLPEPVWVDLEEAARALADARADAGEADWEPALRRARAARELLARELLPAEEAEWVQERRREIEEEELEALELVARCGLELGGGGLGEAERAGRELVERSPYREAGYRVLMQALAAAGNPAEALRVYERLRRVLRDELGTTPAPELQALHSRLLEDGETPTSGSRAPHAGRRLPLPPVLSPRARGAFVGREAELRILGAAWDRAREGDRALVLVGGEPGIGKTRLASEFAVQAQSDGTVLYASCPQETVLPYQPIVEALRHYVLGGGVDLDAAALGPGAAELGRLMPELGTSQGGASGDGSEDPETRRYMMFDAVAAVVAQASERAPILLVLDDLHWADPPTLQLLQHLLLSQRPSSLLVLGTYREGEMVPGHPLASAIADLRRTSRFERIHLSGLDEGGVGALVSFYGGSAAPESLLRTIHHGTDGNPFFVEEVMRHLIENGTLFVEDDRWRSSLTIGEIGVPAAVEEVLVSRVGRLSDDAGLALRNASVLGREFSFDELREMASIDADPLIAALEEALAAQLVVEEPAEGPARYAFTHALVREALYRGMARPRRERMHADAARAIAATRGESGDAEVAALALHYRQAGDAGDPARAIEYSLRAGQRASELLAWDDAVVHLDGAVSLLDRSDGDPELRARLLVNLADLMVVAGDLGRQISYLERALALRERLGDDEQTARVHSRLGAALSLIDSIYAEFLDIGEAFRHFDAAREVLERPEPTTALGHLEVGVATALTYGQRIPEGIEASERAIRIADELDDELLWAGATETFGWHKIGAGELREGVDAHERAFEVAERRRRPFLAWMAMNCAGQLTWGIGDPDRAQAFFERALALPYIDRSSYRRELADGIGRCHLVRGEVDAARTYLSEARPAWITHSLKPLIDLWDGRWDEVEALAGQVLETSRRTGNRWDEWAAEHLRARVLALRGDHEAAAEALEASLPIVAEGGCVYFEMWALPDLVRALARTGRPERARVHLGRCHEILANGEEWAGRAGQVALAEAVLLSSEGRRAEADSAFARALEVFDRYRLAYDRAEAERQGVAQ